MPHVQITLLKGRTVEQKRRVVKRITEVMQQELDVKPQALSIAFVEVSREDYARDGIMIADREESAQ